MSWSQQTGTLKTRSVQTILNVIQNLIDLSITMSINH